MANFDSCIYTYGRFEKRNYKEETKMSVLPEEVKAAEEVAEETAVEVTETAAEEAVTETTETVAEEAAVLTEEDSQQFFAYDQDYARKKKTYAQPVHKLIAIFAVLIAAFLLAFVPMLVLPNGNTLAMIAFFAGIVLVLFGVFVVPSFFKYKLNAWFKSFITDGDKIWMFRFYPYVARTKAESMRGMQKVYNDACYKVSHDKDTVAQLLELVRDKKTPAKHNSYSKLKFV